MFKFLFRSMFLGFVEAPVGVFFFVKSKECSVLHNPLLKYYLRVKYPNKNKKNFWKLRIYFGENMANMFYFVIH